MKHIRILVPLLVLFFFLWRGFSVLIGDVYSPTVLTTPHGLILFPVHWNISEVLHFFKPLLHETLLREDWRVTLYSFSPVFATIVIYLIISLFLYFFSRLHRLEKSFIFHAFALCVFYALLILFLTEHSLPYLFYFTALVTQIFFIFHFHSIIGLRFRFEYYFVLILFAFLLVLRIFPNSAEQETQAFLWIGITGITLLFYVVIRLVLYVFQNHGQWENREIRGRILLSVLIIPNIIVFLFFFLVSPLFQPRVFLAYNSFLFFPSVYAMAFFFVAIRYHIVYFAIPVHRWLLRFVYFLFFSFTYWFTIGYNIGEIPLHIDRRWIHLAAAFVLLIILDPIRTLIFFSMNYIFLRRKIDFDSLMGQFTQEILTPRSFMRFLNKIVAEIKNSLEVYDVKIILNQKIFMRLPESTFEIIYLKEDHPLWFQKKQSSRNFPYYMQNSPGASREVLQRLGGFLIIFLKNFEAGIVVYDKKDNGIFFSEDIRFLRTAIQYIEPMLENYRYLNMSIRMRRQEQLLEETSKIQKKILPSFFSDENITMISSTRAFQKVSGDYFDFIELNPHTYLLFLGDVSGHGLGSGYLQSVIRSLIHGLFKTFQEEINIRHIFNRISRFLSNHYRGSDFMTLFGLTLSFEKTGMQKILRMEYINAGQHYPYIYLKKKKEFISFSETQQLLGFFSQTYTSQTEILQEDIRVFLYSDGAFEFFDRRGEVFGEKKLKEWISQSIHMSVEKQIAFLQERIYFSEDFVKYDDASILILETKLEK